MLDNLEKASVTMSRFTTNDPKWKHGRGWKIQVTDDASGCQVLEVSMTDEEAINLFSSSTAYGSGYVDSSKAGKIREIKTVEIPFSPSDDSPEKDAYIRAIEDDGWMVNYRKDLRNRHRKTKNGMYVVFVRFVDKKTEAGY